jgi:hypothetical protein
MDALAAKVTEAPAAIPTARATVRARASALAGEHARNPLVDAAAPLVTAQSSGCGSHPL